MRSVGEFDLEAQAHRVCGYLNGLSIRAEVEEDDEGPWSIWVHDEEKLDEARHEVASFRLKPDDSKYAEVALQGEVRAKEQAKKVEKLRRKEEKLHRQWNRGTDACRVTFILIGICVIVYLFSSMGQGVDRLLMISIYKKAYAFLPEVRQGQVWRLVTPIFLHLGFLHILFNMYWLFELGRMIEARRGGKFLLGFVLLLAVVSNLCQYLVAGAGFGGMSGVVYGLFGYIWMKGKYDPGDGMHLMPSTVMIMLFWFVFCFFGSMNIANGAHAGGLALGTLSGYLASTVLARR